MQYAIVLVEIKAEELLHAVDYFINLVANTTEEVYVHGTKQHSQIVENIWSEEEGIDHSTILEDQCEFQLVIIFRHSMMIQFSDYTDNACHQINRRTFETCQSL